MASSTTVSVNAGGTLAGGAGSTLGNAATFTSGANTLNLGGTINGNVAIQTGTLQINAAAGGSTLANTITGAGGVIQNSANTLTLTGANTFTGATTISQGRLALSGSGSIANSSGVANAGTFDISGTTAGASITTLSGTGGTTLGAQTLTLTNGSTSYSGAIAGTGRVAVTGGTQTLTGANTYSGGTAIGANGGSVSSTLQLGAPTSAGTGAITFGSMSGTATARLGLNVAAQPASGGTFGNTISNFGAGNELALSGLTNSSVSYNSATTSITVTGTRTGGGQVSENFVLSAPRTTSFIATADGQGNTIISAAPVVCFATGTRIRVIRAGVAADVAVQRLCVGDLAVTASGARRPIRWIGSRLTDCRYHPRPDVVMPVRIRAGALGENRPTRDLVVSPGHAIALDVLGEVLIPASALVNGATIVQEDVESVTYWHVELDSHDLLIAEGQAAESYLDMGNRAFFAYSTGGATVVDLAAGPDGDPALRTHADFCRPFHMDGPLVDVARAQLRLRAERLGWALQDQELGDIHLLVDGARVEPRLRGASASFVVPEGAREVWLITSSGTGLQTVGSPDHRRLGLCVRGLEVKDSFDEPVRVAVEDPRLCVGFHRVERDAADVPYRWTGGRARLPASLWHGLEGDVVLRVDAAGSVLPRWSAATGADHAAVRTPARRDRSVAAAA